MTQFFRNNFSTKKKKISSQVRQLHVSFKKIIYKNQQTNKPTVLVLKAVGSLPIFRYLL